MKISLSTFILITFLPLSQAWAQEIHSDIRKAQKFRAKHKTEKAIRLLENQKRTGDSYNKLLSTIYDIRWSSTEAADEKISTLRDSDLIDQVIDNYPSDSLIGFYYTTLAENASRSNDRDEAARNYSDAILNYQVSIKENPALLAKKFSTHSHYLNLGGLYEESLIYCDLTDSIYKQYNIPPDLILADAYQYKHKNYISLKWSRSATIWFLDHAEPMFKRLMAWDHLARLYFNEGVLDSQKEIYDRSAQWFLKSAEIAKLYQANQWIPTDWPFLEAAKIYNSRLRDPDNALKYARQGLDALIEDRKGSWNHFSLTYNISLAHRSLGRSDSALHYARQSFELETTLRLDTCTHTSAYQDLGVFLKEAGHTRASLESFEILNRLLKNCGANKETLLSNYQKLGVEYYNLLNDYDKAVKYWELTLQLWKELDRNLPRDYGILLLDLGTAYQRSGHGQKANRALIEAATNFKIYGYPKRFLETQMELGLSLLEMEILDSAYNVLSKAIAFAHKEKIQNETLGKVYVHFGDYYDRVRDLDNAYRQLYLAKKILKGSDLSKVYSHLGNLHYRQDRIDSANYYYDQMKAVLIESNAFTKDRKMLLAVNRAKMLKKIEKYDEAILLYKEAINIYHQTDRANLVFGLEAYLDLLECYYQLEQSTAYALTTSEMTPLLDRVDQRRDRRFIRIYNKLAQLTMRYDPHKALSYCQQGFYHNTRVFQPIDSLTNPRATDFVSAEEFLGTAKRKAFILISIANEGDSIYNEYGELSRLMAMRLDNMMGVENNQFYELGLNTYALCDTILNYTRELYTTEEARQALSGEAVRIFELAIFNAYLAYQRTGEKRYLYRAYQFLGQNKARALLEAIRRTGANAFGNVPEALLSREKELNAKLTQLGIIYGNTQDPKVKSEFDKVQADLTSLRQEMKKNSPKYSALRSSDNTASALEIMNKLPDDTGYIEFFLNYDASGAIIATITNDEVDFHFQTFEEPLGNKIRAFRNSLMLRLDGPSKKYGNDLYSELLGLAETHVGEKSKWVIVPDQMLGYIPFEALRDSEGRFLLESKEISYSYSGTLFRDNQQGHDPVKSILSFAPVFENKETNLLVATHERSIKQFHEQLDVSRAFIRDGGEIVGLPGTITELEKIDDLFETKGGTSKYFIHQDANEEQIKSMNLSDYPYLHFATHGIVDEENPQLSGLIMSQDANSSEDCILYAGEVYNLTIDAELVTLSACETGLGKVVNGEGIVGLSRAFLFAGAENVQVSLWKVSDASTSRLMIDFYDGVLSGTDNATALRSAKLNLLNSEQFSAPYYWAPFVLIGL